MPSQNVMDNLAAAQYLENYGYVPPSKMGSLVMPGGEMTREMKEALQRMQAFAGINQTGVLDQETLEIIGTPRCGVKDFFWHGKQAGRSNFNFRKTINNQNFLAFPGLLKFQIGMC